jgi:hypothetical protein
MGGNGGNNKGLKKRASLLIFLLVFVSILSPQSAHAGDGLFRGIFCSVISLFGNSCDVDFSGISVNPKKPAMPEVKSEHITQEQQTTNNFSENVTNNYNFYPVTVVSKPAAVQSSMAGADAYTDSYTKEWTPLALFYKQVDKIYDVLGDRVDDSIDDLEEELGAAFTTLSLTLTGALYDNSNSAGLAGSVLQSTGSGVAWVATSTLGITGGGGVTSIEDLSDVAAMTEASGDLLSWNGTAWVNVATSSLGIAGSLDGSGSANRVAFWSDSNTLTSDSVFTFANSRLTVPTFNASGASSTILSLNNIPLLTASDSQASVGLGGYTSVLGADANSAFGYYALNVTTTGGYNTAIGQCALCSNTTGSGNTALGNEAMNNNISGDSNVAVGDGALYYNATGTSNIGIGYRGAEGVTGSYNIGIGELSLWSAYVTSNQRNIAIGYQAGIDLEDGSDNIFIGYNAGDNLWTGSNNIIIGRNIAAPDSDGSGQLNIGNLLFGTDLDNTGTTISSGNIGIGTTTPVSKLSVAGRGYFTENVDALYFDVATSTGYRVAGVPILYSDYTGSNADFAAGAYALGSRVEGSSFENTALGEFALYEAATSQANVAVGYQAATQLLNGDYNTAVGVYTLWSATSSNRSTVLGYNAGGGARGSNNLLLGYNAGNSLGYGSNNIAIGYDIDLPNANNSNQLNIGNLLFGTGIDGTGTTLSSGNIGIGTSSPSAKLTVAGTGLFTNTVAAPIFNASGASTTIISITDISFFRASTTNTSVFIGENAGISVTSDGPGNTGFGHQALKAVTEGSSNTAMGLNSLLSNTTGSMNTAFGASTLVLNTGSFNNAFGAQALQSNTVGSYNSAFGDAALFANTSGAHNVALGRWTLVANNGTGTIAIGYKAGENLTSGDRNILIGYDIDAPTATSDNILNIGNLLFGTGIDGTGTTLSSGNIGIGTTSPASKLTISGGDVLIDNGEYYNTSGTAINVLGFESGTDNLYLRTGGASVSNRFSIVNTGSTQMFTVLNSGLVGIGTTTPVTTLDVVGTGQFSNTLTLTSSALNFGTGGTRGFFQYATDLKLWGPASGSLQINTGNTSGSIILGNSSGSAQVTMSNSGNVGIGTAPGANTKLLAVQNVGSNFAVRGSITDGGVGGGAAFFGEVVSTAQQFARFDYSGATVGSVTTNGTSVTYNTTSDRRVKENIDTTKLSLANLMQLPVREFTFTADGTHSITNGFIAQELYEVFPWAVATNGDNGIDPLTGSSTPWSVDYGRVTPLLVKSIQDLNLDLQALLIGNPSSTSTFAFLLEEDNTVWSRLVALAENFVDGVLTLAGITTDELCLKDEQGSTCIDREELEALIAGANSGSSSSDTEDEEEEVVLDLPEDDETIPADPQATSTASSTSVVADDEEDEDATMSTSTPAHEELPADEEVDVEPQEENEEVEDAVMDTEAIVELEEVEETDEALETNE